MNLKEGRAKVGGAMYESNLSQKSISNLHITLRHFGNYLSAYKRANINRIKPKDIADYREYMHSLGFKPRTIRNYIVILKAFFKRLHRDGLDCLDPEDIGMPKLLVTVPRYLSRDEVQRIIDAEPNVRNKAMISLAFCSGARSSELTSMLVDDYFGNKILLRQTKTSRQRYVYVSEQTRDYIQEYLASRTDGLEYLFRTSVNASIMPKTINYIFKVSGDRVGLHLYPHLLRHSHATHFLRETGNIRYVQKSLGHVNIQNTVIYTHVVDDDVVGAHKMAFS